MYRKGDKQQARKAPKNGKYVPLTPEEKTWIEFVIKMFIKRLGEWSFDPKGNPEVAMEKQKAFEEKFLKEYFSKDAIKTRATYERESGTIQQGQKQQVKINKKYKGCEIVSFSQYEVPSGSERLTGAHVVGNKVVGGTIKQSEETCVSYTIINYDHDEKIITSENLVAITDEDVVLKWRGPSGGRKSWNWLESDKKPVPEEISREIRPMKGFSVRIEPGGTHKGTICFGLRLPKIVKLEYRK